MRKCPRCHKEMTEECYLQDSAQPISDYVVVQKNEDLKKIEYPLKVSLCKTCGYVEMYVDLDKG